MSRELQNFVIKCFIFVIMWTFIVFGLTVAILNSAPPSGNFYTTTRYFGPSGYLGSKRTYDYGRTYRSTYYNKNGVYQGYETGVKK